METHAFVRYLHSSMNVFLIAALLHDSKSYLFLQGSNHTHSGDGHDKLMGFMKDTFPLAVYGIQDVFSSYIVYLKIWNSNSDPKLIGRWYLENLYNTRGTYIQKLHIIIQLYSV